MNVNNTIIQKSILLALSVIVLGVGISLALTAAIGVGAWEAVSQSISGLINIKVGTVSIMLNVSCVLIQLILLKKDFKLKHILQIFIAILLGNVVNFMLYNVMDGIVLNSYLVNIILLIVAYVICAMSVSLIMAIDLIGLPLESCCMVIGDRLNIKFGTIRQLVDLVAIITVIVFTLLFKETLTVREGTVIGMLIFGPMLNFFMRIVKPRLKVLEIVK